MVTGRTEITHLIQQVEPQMLHLLYFFFIFLLKLQSCHIQSTHLLQRDGLNPLHGVDIKHVHSVLTVH